MRWEVGPSPGKQVADVEGGENEQFNGQLEEVQREKKKNNKPKRGNHSHMLQPKEMQNLVGKKKQRFYKKVWLNIPNIETIREILTVPTLWCSNKQ